MNIPLDPILTVHPNTHTHTHPSPPRGRLLTHKAQSDVQPFASSAIDVSLQQETPQKEVVVVVVDGVNQCTVKGHAQPTKPVIYTIMHCGVFAALFAIL